MELPVRILIADASPLYRQGARLLLQQTGFRSVVMEANCLADMHRYVNCYGKDRWDEQRGVDLVIVDRCLPGLSAFTQLTGLHLTHRPRVLVMAESVDAAFIRQACEAGVEGVIGKSANPEQFADAATTVNNGACWYWKQPVEKTFFEHSSVLSKKQALVLSRLKKGLSNKQIAADLEISENTVKYHVSQIYRKTNIQNPNRTLLALCG